VEIVPILGVEFHHGVAHVGMCGSVAVNAAAVSRVLEVVLGARRRRVDCLVDVAEVVALLLVVDKLAQRREVTQIPPDAVGVGLYEELLAAR